MSMHYDTLIVGAGHAGAQTAISLRQQGYDGNIGLLSREEHLPYERPPLSKEYLSQEKAFDRMLLRPAKFWTDKSIDLKLGCEVIDIDPVSRKVATTTSELTYDSLVWAAGGSARQLDCPGADHDGVYTIRTKDDADKIACALENGAESVCVVGGGYIGLEAAAALRKRGCKVTLIESLSGLLGRVTGKQVADFIEREHRFHNVDIRFHSLVDKIDGLEGRVTGVQLTDGTKIACDMVIVGVGLLPETEVLARAGAQVGNGILVDEYCRTTLPYIYAAGDCAAHINPFADGKMVRLESVQNANDMATTVAKHICEKPEPYRSLPWFWSHQYDIKLQTIGLSSGSDQTILRGNPDNKSFSVVYLKNGQVIAIDCVNAMKDYAQGRKLIGKNISEGIDTLSDPCTSIKEFISEC